MGLAFKKTKIAVDKMPVQYVESVTSRSGEVRPKSNVCRIEVICTSDGSPRAWEDDGYSQDQDGEPNQKRAQCLRNLKLRNGSMPMWVVREQLKPWESSDKGRDGYNVVYGPLNIPVVTPEIQKFIDENVAQRGHYLAGAKGTAATIVAKSSDGSKPKAVKE